jgi:hypothetical protein
MNITRRNLLVPALIDAIRALSRDDKPMRGYIQAVYVRQGLESDWRFVIARCVLTGKTADRQEEIYRDYAFLSKPVSDLSIESFLSAITGDGYVLSPAFPALRATNSTPNWSEELIPSDVSGIEFPVRKFSSTIDQNAFFSESQLIAFDMPFRFSAARYVKQFLGLKEFHGSSDGRRGELWIEVNDKRGAIRLEPTRLSIAGRTEDLCLVGQINDGDSVKLMNDETTALDGKSIANIELWLLTRSNEIIDYRSSTEWPYRYETDPDSAAHGETLKHLIHRGESELCEFKKYIDLTENANEKSAEIEKAVCAFSNLNGGRLLIGVDNEGEVIGLESQLLRDYRCELEKASTLYERAIRSRLREILRDNQCFSTEIVTLYAKTVVVITVTRASETNFLLNSNQAYIRRGATDAKMSPIEIRTAQPLQSSEYPLLRGGN